MSAPLDLTPAERRRGLVAAIVGVSVFAACLGHSLPFFAVRLASLGASNSFIGVNVALSALAGLALTPFLPAVIGRYGIRRVLAAAFAVIFAGYAAAFLSGERLYLWHVARLLIGAGSTAFFVASEIWINLAVSPERRGAVVGLYATALAGGFAAGPLALELTGYDGASPFIAGAAFLVLAAPPILTARPPAFSPREKTVSVAVVTRRAPIIFLAMAVFSLGEAALLSLAPVYGLRIGLGEVAAGRIVLAYSLGPVAFQYLLGLAADRYSPRIVLAACAAAGLAGAALLPAAVRNELALYPLLFVWGGAIVGVATCVLAYVGGRFAGKELAAANSGIALAYNAGALAGPALGGAIMDLAGPDALPAALAGAFALLLMLLAPTRPRLGP
ncbi:MFS transporter [Amphiplicatus metriothermophilus]|uniref:Cyanate permease n=1 Tax=Amphiplicatus metriothermophilus TaxID=1519374 RepID=A0A239PNU1_9PROT|nr:MFS transporter [Amphiplicatus metriothermophilus]MBB5518876.1 MFS family permease [Amphiplicatus metriothermophilus]SNT71971.1 Cyanate permease [Amphiplicatus metriothermophilus]